MLPLDQRREEVEGGEEKEVGQGHGEACVRSVISGGGRQEVPQSRPQERLKSCCGGEHGPVGVGKHSHLGPIVVALAHQGAAGIPLKPNTRFHPHQHLATHTPSNELQSTNMCPLSLCC